MCKPQAHCIFDLCVTLSSYLYCLCAFDSHLFDSLLNEKLGDAYRTEGVGLIGHYACICIYMYVCIQAYEEARRRHQLAEEDKKKLVCI